SVVSSSSGMHAVDPCFKTNESGVKCVSPRPLRDCGARAGIGRVRVGMVCPRKRRPWLDRDGPSKMVRRAERSGYTRHESRPTYGWALGVRAVGRPSHQKDQAMLRISNLKKSYGGHDVLLDVSFELGDREKVALVGPNGAGKSSLLKIVAGVLTADDGVVRV